jgi:uncharacterized LabA/DUF88 family protein
MDPDSEAYSLSQLVRPLGRDARKIAIVAKDDDQRLLSYQRAGYETHAMGKDRAMELRQFIRQMAAQIKQSPPKHLVLVSDDPEFVHLCDMAASFTDVSIWANSATVPRELTDSNYGFRPLEELLPNLKIPRIDVRIDIENIFLGLASHGWEPNLRELIEAIHQAVDDLGEIVAVTGYADWDELNQQYGEPDINWQRELTLAGGESHYVVNQHGKNTTDMKIADDIRTLVEHDPGGSSAIDIIVLVTMDRDFRYVMNTAQRRGKKVVVLALEGGLSRELEDAASEVRYLNDFLTLARPSKIGTKMPSPSQHTAFTTESLQQDRNEFTVFISYAHKDNEGRDPSKRWLDRLLEQIQPLVLQNQVSTWSDTEIEIGEHWHESIQTQLQNAKVAVLLISPAFLASKYIRNSELPGLLMKVKQKGVTVLPIVLRHCLYSETKFKYPDPVNGPEEISLATFQAANPPSRPLNAMDEHEQDLLLLSIAQRILRIVQSGN